MALGAFVGAAPAGYMINRIGRKGTIMSTSLFYALGWLLIIYSNDQDIGLLYFGRVVTGIGVGIASLAVPVIFNILSIYHCVLSFQFQ